MGRWPGTPLALCVALLATAYCRPAAALSAEGHMTTAAIAYTELKSSAPQTIDRIVALLRDHPDRGSFRVAAHGTDGAERDRQLFLEMARWPDDIRLGAYDHPTWHYGMHPLAEPLHPPPAPPRDAVNGSALEALALSTSVAGDAHAPANDRAIALCWLFHLVGDIHQPLHAAEGFASDHPNGDGGGDLEYVRDPVSGKSVSLHWYWDIAANHTGTAPVLLAAALAARAPRGGFHELVATGGARNFNGWAAESYALARAHVYRTDLATAADAAAAPELPPAYVADSQTVMERRITLAGYRLADLLKTLLP
jgi:S1/P1 Nuclease